MANCSQCIKCVLFIRPLASRRALYTWFAEKRPFNLRTARSGYPATRTFSIRRDDDCIFICCALALRPRRFPRARTRDAREDMTPERVRTSEGYEEWKTAEANIRASLTKPDIAQSDWANASFCKPGRSGWRVNWRSGQSTIFDYNLCDFECARNLRNSIFLRHCDIETFFAVRTKKFGKNLTCRINGKIPLHDFFGWKRYNADGTAA